MLLLTRTVGRSVLIGPKIEVKIMEVHGFKVLLGIQAPFDCVVDRKENYERLLAGASTEFSLIQKDELSHSNHKKTKIILPSRD